MNTFKLFIFEGYLIFYRTIKVDLVFVVFVL